jgi:hypothetical protein
MEGAGGTTNVKKKEMWIEVAQPQAKQAPAPQPMMSQVVMPQVAQTAQPAAAPQEAKASTHQEDAWRKETASLKKTTLEFDKVPMPGEVVFETITDILAEDGYYAISPKTTSAHGFFRAMARFSKQEGPERVFLEVMSKEGESKIILRTFDASDPQKAADVLLSELTIRIDIEPYRKKAPASKGDNKG